MCVCGSLLFVSAQGKAKLPLLVFAQACFKMHLACALLFARVCVLILAEFLFAALAQSIALVKTHEFASYRHIVPTWPLSLLSIIGTIEWLIYSRRYANAPIHPKPVFILGVQRSGEMMQKYQTKSTCHFLTGDRQP